MYEYVDRGCEDDVALEENAAAFRRVKLLQRVMVDVSRRNTAIDLFGQRLSMPVVIAPTGSAALLCYEGELVLARAAGGDGQRHVDAASARVNKRKTRTPEPTGSWQADICGFLAR